MFSLPKFRLAVVAGALLIASSYDGPSIALGSDDRPSFVQIRDVTFRHFKTKGIGPLDIITRGETKPLLLLIVRMGWEVPDQKKLLGRIPEDNALLVRLLRSKGGEAFMRQTSGYPGAYDQMDHLSRMPQGRQTLVDLIRGPDGYKMIEYLTTTQGGTALQKQLSNVPGHEQFGKPTGRIYAPQQLVAELERLYRVDDRKRGPARQ